LLSVSATTPWYGLLVTTSDLLIWPARQLASAINTSVLAGTQLLVYLEFLLSILIYGLLARLLVRLLNRWLNGH
jgi:hypothetical protein